MDVEDTAVARTILAAALVLVVGGGSAACSGVPPGLDATPPPGSHLAVEASALPSDSRPSLAPTAAPTQSAPAATPTATPTPDLEPPATASPDLAPGFASASAPEGDATLLDTAVPLADGRVLILDECATDAQLYDVAAATFTTTGSLTESRLGKTATLLSDGRVLVTGGYDCTSSGSDGISASAEIYDPASGTFEPTGAMKTARQFHAATLLDDGRVLITGGHSNEPSTATAAIRFASVRTAETSESILSTAELFDPATGTFRSTGLMTTFRDNHTATLLPDGKVLVVGGGGEAYASVVSADLYDPATDEFRATGSMREGRSLHTASLLPDGRVLVVGGRSPEDATYPTAEMYDPAAGTFTSAGAMRDGRQEHTATLLLDGRVFIAGGYWSDGRDGRVLARTEMFDPSTDTFTSIGSMGDPRTGHTATLLPDGHVLIVGGIDIGSVGGFPVRSAVLYEP